MVFFISIIVRNKECIQNTTPDKSSAINHTALKNAAVFKKLFTLCEGKLW